jgi:hypothetical protein
MRHSRGSQECGVTSKKSAPPTLQWDLVNVNEGEPSCRPSAAQSASRVAPGLGKLILVEDRRLRNFTRQTENCLSVDTAATQDVHRPKFGSGFQRPGIEADLKRYANSFPSLVCIAANTGLSVSSISASCGANRFEPVVRSRQRAVGTPFGNK